MTPHPPSRLRTSRLAVAATAASHTGLYLKRLLPR